VPAFFGVALFMFEGNALALEINYQTENREKVFPQALKYALLNTVLMVLIIGCFSFAAYG
jgi:amino acid permease